MGTATAPGLVVVRSGAGVGVPEADFALKELQRGLGGNVPLFVGAEPGDVIASWTGPSDTQVLVLDSPWLSLEPRCLPRLQAALANGFAAALACSSSHPGPMGSPGYVTARGMERFVDAFEPRFEAWHGTDMPGVVLSTVAALRESPREPGSGQGMTRALVVGAWSHDAAGYFAFAREEVLPLVPPGVRQALDVGGGTGGFLAAMKQAFPQVHTTLVEAMDDAAAVARSRPGLDAVWQGDFAVFDTPERFDCISFLDVLEHMAQPEAALARARELLSPGGVVLASIPNVGHWSVVADLLEGRWDWAPAGIHCITHLRFFTRRTIADMFRRCGYEVEAWSAVELPGTDEQLGALAGGPLVVDRDSLQTYAFLLRARPLP